MPTADLTPDDERRLIALVTDHDRLEGYPLCESCGLPHPCPTREDALLQLQRAGVSLDESPTIWS